MEVYTGYTLPRAAGLVYTVETDTELYNRLVPWDIATHVRSNGIKRAIRHECQRTEKREGRVELRENRGNNQARVPENRETGGKSGAS